VRANKKELDVKSGKKNRVVGRGKVDNKDSRSPSRRRKRTGPAAHVSPTAERESPPRGRDQVIDAIIEATIELCRTGGPDKVTLRRVADHANVNYGLVHRHFGTKAEVIKAAMRRAHERSFHVLVEPSQDLETAVGRILVEGSNTLARVMAWGILQGEIDNILPAAESSLLLTGLYELAVKGSDAKSAADSLATRVTVGTLVASLLGWRLFEPYITRGLKLAEIGQPAIYRSILSALQRLINQGHVPK
jgi:AcrR family transcriptional regulator